MVELSPDLFSLRQRQNLVPDPPVVTTHSAAAIHTSEMFAVVPTGGKAQSCLFYMRKGKGTCLQADSRSRDTSL